MHFISMLAGLKKIVCYTENFVIWRFVKSTFHCISRLTVNRCWWATLTGSFFPALSKLFVTATRLLKRPIDKDLRRKDQWLIVSPKDAII